MRRRDESMEERFLRGGEAVEPKRERRQVHPTAAFIGRGILRFLLFVAVAAAVSAGLGLLIGALADSDLRRAALLGLYFGGAAIIAVPVLSSGGRSYSSGGYEIIEIDVDPELRKEWQSRLSAYVFIGLAVILIGVLLEVAGFAE